MESLMGEMSVKVRLLTNYTPATEQRIREAVHSALTNASKDFNRSLESELLKHEVFQNVKVNTIIT